MESVCPLCRKPVTIKKTKKGGYYWRCDPCKAYSFVNSDEGKRLLEVQAENPEGLEPSDFEDFAEMVEAEAGGATSPNPGNPASSGDAAIIGEIKALGKRLAAVEKKLPVQEPGSEEPEEDGEDPKYVETCSVCGTRFNYRVKGITPAGLLSKAGLFCPSCKTRLETPEGLSENPKSEDRSFTDWDA